MMQSAANHSPRSSSLLNRELTGNFGVFGPKMSPGEVEKSRFYKGFSANSLLNGTGNFKPRTGNFFGGTGNFRGGAGTLSKPHFCSRAKFESAKEVGPLGEWTGTRRVNSTADDCPPSPLRWRTRMRASSAHALRVTIGQQSLRTPATKQPDQTLLLKEHVSALGVAEAVLSVMGNRSGPALSKPSSAWA